MRAFVTFGLLLVLSATGGCTWPSLLITPVNRPLKLEEVQVQPGKGFAPDKIAIVEVEGLLMNARSDGLLTPGENKVSLFLEQFNQIESDPRVKAVVLRINSPGGTVAASDTMYQIVARFKQRTGKPVVASAQDVAASGAYYVALACDKIVAHPTSIVGSIGVIFQTFEFSETMRKIGVSADAIKSGPNKDMGSPFRPLGTQERALMQAMVNEFYGKF
jgi:protease-4